MNLPYEVRTARGTVAAFLDLDDADDFAQKASRKQRMLTHFVVHVERAETVITRAYNGNVESIILQNATRRA